MKLRRFTEAGIAAFTSFRSELIENPTSAVPWSLLEDPALTEIIDEAIELGQPIFKNRLEAGMYLNSVLSSTSLQLPERDRGLWTWLTLFFFDQVCPPDGNGVRKVLGEERLLPLVDNHQRFYRHLLLGPFLIVRAHSDNPMRAIAMLCTPLNGPGEIAGQLAAYKQLVTNKAVAEVASMLYYNPTTSSFRRGAGSSVKGAPRRFAALLNQLDLTYYLYGMSADDLLSLLPAEFNRFKVSISA